MKNKNIWRIIWMAGIYIILFIILYLVIQYKVKWEGKDLGPYLYFYNCSNSLCTTTDEALMYYSKIKCEHNKCPHIKEKKDNLVIVSTTGKEYVFDYLNDKIINNTYRTYSFTDVGYIVSDKSGNYGIIDEVGEIKEELKYKEIMGYNDGYIAYIENSKIGIKNESKKVDVKPLYEEVILINDNIYAYLEDNKYYIASYNTELPINNTNYDYLYAIDNNNILIIRDKKIDIIDNTLKSVLILKIDTDYTYTKAVEKSSLNIIKEGNLLEFNVYDKDDNVTKYIFDIKNRKLYN